MYYWRLEYFERLEGGKRAGSQAVLSILHHESRKEKKKVAAFPLFAHVLKVLNF